MERKTGYKGLILIKKLLYIITFLNLTYLNALEKDLDNNTTKLLPKTILSKYIGDSIYLEYADNKKPISTPIIHINNKKSLAILKNDLGRIKKLIVPKGKYTFHGITYNFNKEGLHRIIDFANNDSIQVIVYNSDTLKLLSAFAWITKHGTRDNSKKFKNLNKIAKNGYLSLTCGAISHYTLKYLHKLQIPSRLIHFNREKDFNGYDDGHILLEVKIYNKWVLVDIDSNTIFYGKRKGFLSAFDVATTANGYKKHIKLASDNYLDSMNFKDKKINYAFNSERALYSLDNWYSNIIRVLHIYTNGGGTLCRKSAHWNEVKKAYGYKTCLKPKEFYKKFYGERK